MGKVCVGLMSWLRGREGQRGERHGGEDETQRLNNVGTRVRSDQPRVISSYPPLRRTRGTFSAFD